VGSSTDYQHEDTTMALTNKTRTAWILRIFEIKRQLDALNSEKIALAKRLGPGTFQATEYPGSKLTITEGSTGWSVPWKDVAYRLAEKYSIPESAFGAVINRYKEQTYRGPSVSVRKDTVDRRRLSRTY
jgi:hypothetical protein